MLPSFLTAFALVAATGGPSAPASDAWLSLDKEIQSLAAASAPQTTEAAKGFQVSGWIKTQYDYSSDTPFQVDPTNDVDLSGFGFEGVRLNFKGEVGGYELKVSIDGKDGTVKL